MTDRPILFSRPMVRALLDGRKTQTRRVHFTQDPEFRLTCDDGCDDRLSRMCLFPKATCGRRRVTAAKFAVGDRLWVREAWRTEERNDFIRPRDLRVGSPLYYAAGGGGEEAIPECAGKLRPSMFMPRWTSRLTLVVTEVRVKRLQDISEADAIAEGIERDPETHAYWGADGQGVGGATRLYENGAHAYSDLWDHLNAARGFGWDANPWVVAITFTVHHQNIDALGAKEAA